MQPDRYDDHMRPRVQRDGLYNVTRQIMDNNNPEKWQHDKYEGPVVRRKPSIARSRNDTTGFKLCALPLCVIIPLVLCFHLRLHMHAEHKLHLSAFRDR
jgi:hypothetical protein